ncbi:DUF983 domain-containing protein [Imperialibacter roseus]|uniref:DUF983 domain-containing protein n=1 Tax=Imperialibacter roseus TaxID=1324217 RepID=A0ABZ0IZ34_9BACT|nr:DUF983 domain-containing protein [Imperialibacter roseus]WOK09635.1 DUF983 domain-containing protein [Imperialibacter roseus]
MSKTSALQAIVHGKCPRCRSGNMFVEPNFRLKDFDKMPVKCEVCGLRFEPEPMFYNGAMYVSYAISVALTIIVGFSVYFIFDNPDMWVYMAAIVTVVLLLSTTMFRYSRILYLHAFGGIKYDASFGVSSKDK